MINPQLPYYQNNDFVISEYLDFLIPSELPSRRKEKKFICPNCGEHHLSINADGKKYDCYGCGDKTAIAQKLIQLKKEATSTERKIIKPSQKREWIYLDLNNQPYIKIVRVDDGNGKKKIYQQSYVNGKWQKGFGKNISQSNCQLLYPDEIKRAISNNQLIFIVEGESCTDALRELGLTATTNIGGSGKNYQGYDVLKDYPNLVLCPDRDTQGLKHMETVAERLNHQPRWFYVPSQLWNNLDSSGGIDIEDFINEKKSEKLTNEKIKESIMNLVGDKQEFSKTEKENKVIEFPTPKILDKDGVYLVLQELVNQNIPEAQLRLRLNEISQNSGIHVIEIEKIYQSIIKEDEQQELTIDLSQNLTNILEIENQDLNLSSVLPLSISNHLTSLAEKMKVTPEHLLTATLPTWSSMIGTKSQIIVSSGMGYAQPPILRTMIVGNSGDRKTPILKNATHAIFQMDKESVGEYQRKKEIYEEELEMTKKGDPKPKPPTPPKRYIIDDFNYEGAIRVHSENENGLFASIDELKGYFARMNKQTGKGDDEQKDLSLFNGGAIIKDRMSEDYSYYIPKSAISMTGSIQWDILGDLIQEKGDSDSAGVICRWLMCGKPLGQAKLNLFDDDYNLFDEFKTEQRDLLEYLRDLPKNDYLLSDSAKRLWQTYQHHLEDLRAIETNQALSVAYPKYESYMSRLALTLHCVESYYSGQKPQPTISGQTMKRAIEMTEFYLNQYRYILAKISPSQSLTGDLIKIRDLLNKKQSLTVTQVREGIRELKRKSAKEARTIVLDYFQTLVNSGFAVWEKSGKKIRTNQDSFQDKSGQNQETPKTFNINAFSETEKDKSGQIRTKSGHLKTSIDNGLSTKSGQNQDFNSYFENPASNINTESSYYLLDSVKDEKSQENKIVTEVNCPEKCPKDSQNNDLSCPENVLICPEENLEPSHSKDSNCPEKCPDFQENCPDFWSDENVSNLDSNTNDDSNVSSVDDISSEYESINFNQMMSEVIELLIEKLDLTKKDARKDWICDYFYQQLGEEHSFGELYSDSKYDDLWINLLETLRTQ